MITEVDYEVEVGPPDISWWWYLVVGIAWFAIGLFVLSWNPATINLIGITTGVVVMLAGVFEFCMAFALPGWRWLRAIVGLFFVVIGVLAFMSPFRTFVSLAMLFGWYLIVKGGVVVVLALSDRQPGSLWGLALAVGAVDLIIGLWAIGYPGRSAWLLVLWIGIGALLHGLGDIVQAFHVRSLQ